MILTFIPKDKKMILFSSWFGQKYADSSMFEYEYLLRFSDYKAIWYTLNDDIYRNLKSKNMPVVHGKTLKGIWTQIRAKVLVSSVQMADFNCMYLQNAILLDLDHGFPIKQVGFAQPDYGYVWKSFQRLLRWGLDYRATASSSFCCEKICEIYSIPPSKVVFVNKPRLDLFFDKSLWSPKNKIVDSIKNGRMAFVWMPTHRSCGKVSIDVSLIINLEKLQRICEDNNIVFIIKKHFYHRNEHVDTDKYPNIYDLTTTDIDSQTLLAQTDVLISDYSASYVDFMVLDRPILLFAYDLDSYLKTERGLYVSFEENTAGEIVTTGDELLSSIERITMDPYDSKYAEGRQIAKTRYFDKNVEIGTSRKKVKQIIDDLIDNKYSHNWAH